MIAVIFEAAFVAVPCVDGAVLVVVEVSVDSQMIGFEQLGLQAQESSPVISTSFPFLHSINNINSSHFFSVISFYIHFRFWE